MWSHHNLRARPFYKLPSPISFQLICTGPVLDTIYVFRLNVFKWMGYLFPGHPSAHKATDRSFHQNGPNLLLRSKKNLQNNPYLFRKRL